MTRASSAIVIAISVAAACAACGSDDRSAVAPRPSAATPFAGPLNAEAAVGALECRGERPYFRSRSDYTAGLEEVQPDLTAAFDDYVAASGIGYRAPLEGYRVERKERDRALLSYDVDDRTKVAIVLRDGMRDFDGGVGWGVVAWAVCDPAEFPAAITDELNVGVWHDVSGRRVPATRVRSFRGAEHCEWTDITFLLIGPDERRADWYVRDPTGELRDYQRGAFDPGATLPDGATSTGWSRGGRELWLAADEQAAYLVDAGDPHDVERWPAATEPILCA